MTLNKIQRVILIAGLVMFAVIGLYPPWTDAPGIGGRAVLAWFVLAAAGAGAYYFAEDTPKKEDSE